MISVPDAYQPASSLTRPTYIAVTHPRGSRTRGAAWMKRYLLLYDLIAFPSLDKALEDFRGKGDEAARCADEYEWLRDKGVIDTAPWPHTAADLRNDDVAKDIFDALELSNIDDRSRTNLDTKRNISDHFVRAIAAHLRASGKTHTFPLLETQAWNERFTTDRRGQVIQLVIKGFPDIDDTIPFEDVLQLRSESEFLARRDAMRVWIRKAAEGKASLTDLEEELIYLLNQYETYMSAVSIRYSLNSIGSILKFSAALSSQIATLRLKEAIDTVFSLAATPASLIEAELKAPGREVSYLSYLSNSLR